MYMYPHLCCSHWLSTIHTIHVQANTYSPQIFLQHTCTCRLHGIHCMSVNYKIMPCYDVHVCTFTIDKIPFVSLIIHPSLNLMRYLPHVYQLHNWVCPTYQYMFAESAPLLNSASCPLVCVPCSLIRVPWVWPCMHIYQGFNDQVGPINNPKERNNPLLKKIQI